MTEPRQPEYPRVELVWPGKRTEVERVRLPFQVIERVNDVRRAREGQAGLLSSASQLPDWWPEGWRNKLIWGDNKYVLASLLDEFAGKVDLIYIDPPFATGADFSINVKLGDLELEKLASSVEEVAYRDTWREGTGSYLQMMQDRLILMKDLLGSQGQLYLHCDYRLASHLNLLLQEIFGADGFLNEVVWRYRRWPASTKAFQRMHDTLFRYTKGRPEDVHWEQLYEPRAESTQKAFGNKKIVTTHNDSGAARLRKTEEESLGTYMSDVWEVSYIQGSASEERSRGNYYPTQKPEKLLERVILSSCPEGGLVLDSFCGSGTTCEVAERLARRWIGVDLSRFAIHTTRKRMLSVAGCRPFEALNLGRYERRYWQGVEIGKAIAAYYNFIVQLYGAQPMPGFLHLHGIRADRVIHVGATDAPVTLDELEKTLQECAANGLRQVDVLGWEWEMGLNPAGKETLARKYGVDVRLLNIPREVMDKRAVEAGDVHFFELSVVELQATAHGNDVTVELKGFLPAIDEYMRAKVGDKVKKWSDWIDYWSVDFEFDGETFVNQWQAYRTRKDPKLALRSDPHVYAQPGTYRIVVKVIDIFGNDTTQDLTVAVPEAAPRRAKAKK